MTKYYSCKNPSKRVKLKGKLLSTIEEKVINEVWYFSPRSGLKYKVTPDNILNIFKKLLIVLSDKDLSRIPISGKPDTKKNITLRKKLAGKFLVDNKNKICLWYVDPKEHKRRQLFMFDLTDMLRSMSVKMNQKDLDKIPNGD